MCPSTVGKSTQPSPSLPSTSMISNSNPTPIRSDTISLFPFSISSSFCNGKESTFLRSSIGQSDDYYTKKRIDDLHDRMDDLQINSFLKFLNHHLGSKYKPIEVHNLAKDLSNGHIWIDLIEILSSKKFRREHGRTRFHALTNVQNVLDYLKSRMQHINISPHEIISGNRKQILALLWIIMKTFDFPGFRLTTNRHLFSEQTLFGYGQDRSTIINWLNHILNQSYRTEQVYIEDFYLQTWISTCYFLIIVKYLLPLSRTYLTGKSFDYLKQLENPLISNQQRFQCCLDLSNYSFNTITQIDFHDKTERSLFRYFTEFQLNVFNCLKTHQIEKSTETNSYMKQLINSVVPSARKEHSSVIHHQQEYLILIQDDSLTCSSTQTNSSSDDESLQLKTVEKSRSFTEQQQTTLKRRDRWNSTSSQQDQRKSSITNEDDENVQSTELKNESSTTNIQDLPSPRDLNQELLSIVNEENSLTSNSVIENDDRPIVLEESSSLESSNDEEEPVEFAAKSTDGDSLLINTEQTADLGLSDDSEVNSNEFSLSVNSNETSSDNADNDDVDRSTIELLVGPVSMLKPNETTFDDEMRTFSSHSSSSFLSQIEEDERSVENSIVPVAHTNGNLSSEEMPETESSVTLNETTKKMISMTDIDEPLFCSNKSNLSSTNVELPVSNVTIQPSFDTPERILTDESSEKEIKSCILPVNEVEKSSSSPLLLNVTDPTNISTTTDNNSEHNDIHSPLPTSIITILSSNVVDINDELLSFMQTTQSSSSDCTVEQVNGSHSTLLDQSQTTLSNVTESIPIQTIQECAISHEQYENSLQETTENVLSSQTQQQRLTRSIQTSKKPKKAAECERNRANQQVTQPFIDNHQQRTNSTNEIQHGVISMTKPTYSTVVKNSSASTNANPLILPSPSKTNQEKLPIFVAAQPIRMVHQVSVEPVRSISTEPTDSSSAHQKRSRRNNKNAQKPSVPTIPSPPLIIEDQFESMPDTLPTFVLETQERILSTTPNETLPTKKSVSPTRTDLHSRKMKKKKITITDNSTKSSSTAVANNATPMINRNIFVLIKEYLRDPRMVALKYVFFLFCFCFTLIILVVHQ